MLDPVNDMYIQKSTLRFKPLESLFFLVKLLFFMYNKTMIRLEFREIFCNDFKIPIRIFQSPFFEYYMNLFNKDLDTLAKAEIFNKTLQTYSTLDNFKEEWHKIKNGIVSDIESVEEYKRLISLKEGYQTPFKVERGNPYNFKFKDVECISIDLISANFNCLKNYNSKIVLDTNNFKELVSKYTTCPYYSEVKIFRQVVFEKLHPNKQQGLQREMMDQVLKDLFKEFPNLYVRMPSNDEIVVPLNQDYPHLKSMVLQIVKNHKLSSMLKTESFVVRHIFDDCFYKEFEDGKIQLRQVPTNIFSQAYKKARGLPLTEEDLYFMHEGKLAKFMEQK